MMPSKKVSESMEGDEGEEEEEEEDDDGCVTAIISNHYFAGEISCLLRQHRETSC